MWEVYDGWRRTILVVAIPIAYFVLKDNPAKLGWPQYLAIAVVLLLAVEYVIRKTTRPTRLPQPLSLSTMASSRRQRELAAARDYESAAREYERRSPTAAKTSLAKEEWLACTDPLKMLSFLHGSASARKFRLFAVACARDEFASGTIPEYECSPQNLPQYEGEIERAEDLADGGPPISIGLFSHWVTYPPPVPEYWVALAALGFDHDVGLWTGSGPIEETVAAFIARYGTHPAHYLRDIFGNVYYSGALSPKCKNRTVVSIAESVYRSRQMPVGHLDRNNLLKVCKALEQSGCTDSELLGHLQSPGPHVRGCWAIDLLLGKE